MLHHWVIDDSAPLDSVVIRPLDYGKTVISANARYEMNGEKKLNPDAKDKGGRFSATFVDQFADDTVGTTCSATERQTLRAEIADLHLAISPGSDVALFNGLLVWGLAMAVAGAAFCWVLFG